MAPVTSLCLSPDGKLLFAGCWDKAIWSWDTATGQPRQKYEGHVDFVRSVTSARLRGEDLLISGGADAQVLVFNIASGERLQTFKDHARGIQDLALDPESEDTDPVVFSAGSDREIRQFSIFGGGNTTDPLLPHETSVYKLFFDNDGDLWTTSADKTAKCLVRQDGWKPNLTLEHPDFVRDVVVYETGGWVVTACRDEEVRVWNRSVRALFTFFFVSFGAIYTDIDRLEHFIIPSLVTSRRLLGLCLLDQPLSAWESMPQSANGPCGLMSFRRQSNLLRSLQKKRRRKNQPNRC